MEDTTHKSFGDKAKDALDKTGDYLSDVKDSIADGMDDMADSVKDTFRDTDDRVHHDYDRTRVHYDGDGDKTVKLRALARGHRPTALAAGKQACGHKRPGSGTGPDPGLGDTLVTFPCHKKSRGPHCWTRDFLFRFPSIINYGYI